MDIIIQFFKDHLWLSQVAIAMGILLITWIVAKIAVRLDTIMAKRVAAKTETKYDDEVFEIIGQGVRRIIWLVGIGLAIHFINRIIPKDSLGNQILSGIVYVFLVLVITQMLSKLLITFMNWYMENWGKKLNFSIRDEFGPLLRRIIVIILYVMAIIHILHHFNQNISSILVSFGVGSLAVALAAKDTLANMISGFMIMTDRPFRLGDRIMLESGEKGDVYDIGLRTTKILTFENTLIVVPNQQIVNEKVTNLSYPDPQIRVTIDIGVAYGTNLSKAKQILVDICNAHPKVLDAPEPYAYFLNFGESSLDLRALCRVHTWGDQWMVAEELRMAVYKAYEEANIEIPFPQHVVTLKKE